MTLRALQRKRLLDHTVEAIKEYVRENSLRVGDRLPSENELADKLQVSRNVVRQALSSLEGSGIVRIEHGRGAFISEPSANRDLFENLSLWLDLDNLDTDTYYQIRLGLEQGLLQLVIDHATEQDLQELEALASEMERRSPDNLGSLHKDFHRVLLKASGNRYLVSIGTLLYEYTFWVTANAPNVRRIPPNDLPRVHTYLVAGLRKRDPALIPQLIAVHVGYTPLP